MWDYTNTSTKLNMHMWEIILEQIQIWIWHWSKVKSNSLNLKMYFFSCYRNSCSMFSRWSWVACGFYLVLNICSPDGKSSVFQIQEDVELVKSDVWSTCLLFVQLLVGWGQKARCARIDTLGLLTLVHHNKGAQLPQFSYDNFLKKHTSLYFFIKILFHQKSNLKCNNFLLQKIKTCNPCLTSLSLSASVY